MRDDGFPESPQVKNLIDPDRANVAGISNRDVANSAAGNAGNPWLAERGNKRSPWSPVSAGTNAGSLGRLKISTSIRRMQKLGFPYAAATVLKPGDRKNPPSGAFPDHLCPTPPRTWRSRVGSPRTRHEAERSQEKPSPRLSHEIGGEKAKQRRFPQFGGGTHDFDPGNLPRISHPVQQRGQATAGPRRSPLWRVGALIASAIMNTPFGFMAFLGVASLIGVIVSHVIVLFDFIEEMHEKGEPLERGLPTRGSNGCVR